MRRIRERIEQLKQASEQTADPQPITGNGFQIAEDPADNRILITFRRQASRERPGRPEKHGLEMESNAYRLGANAQQRGPCISSVRGAKIGPPFDI